MRNLDMLFQCKRGHLCTWNYLSKKDVITVNDSLNLPIS